jgi:tetratricopeptide (TPR) repeat protein
MSDKEYADLIIQADQSFENNQMEASLVIYNKAVNLKKTEVYPKDQIKKIELYQSLLKKADQLVVAKDYTGALTSLNEALIIRPTDSIVKDKIAKVNQLIADKKSEDEQALAQQNAYNQAIKDGDQYFTAKNYTQSLTRFNEALAIRSNEAYPKRKIKEIEGIIDQLAKEQARKDKEYQASIDRADQLLEKKDYLNAKAEYERSLAIKSEETYPKNQLQVINDALAEISRKEEEAKRLQKEKSDQEYNLAMAEGEKAFNANDFPLAKTNYQTALQIRQNDVPAKQKLGETEAKLAQIARMQLAYNNAITEANKQLTLKNYIGAKTKYQESLQYVPDSDYPKKQILKIDEVLAQQEAELKLKQDYNQAVTEAENLFKNKELAKAKEAYSKAYNLIPSEPVPPKRISEINDLLAEQARQEAETKATYEAYQNAIQRADKLFSSKDYNSARLTYNEALLIKADEKYPADQIALIEKLLADLAEQEYKSAITKADNLFSNNQFDQAKTSYQEALNFKKNDAYALQRIKDSDLKKAELEAESRRLKKLQDDYAALIAEAANDLSSKIYLKAKEKYQQALKLKPAEILPKEQIAKIDQLLAQLQKEEDINKQYNQHIQLAQLAFNQNKLKEARDEYQKAYNFKPFEPVPPARIAEIDKMLAQLAEAAQLAAQEEAQRIAKAKADQEQYDKAVAAADKAFAEKQYKIARNHYTTALIALPNEKYPKDQIAKIDELLKQYELDRAFARQKAEQDSLQNIRDLAFNERIKTAAAFEQSKQYEQAIGKYKEAIQVNPSKRNDVQTMIAAAEEKLQLMLQNEANYKQFIKLADDLYSATKLEDALAQYQNALKIKNNEEYPKKQIAEIQASLAAHELKYTTAIQNADRAFNSSDWISAKTNYTQALAVKPGETYPAARLTEVNQKINDANLASQNLVAMDKAYKEAMEQAEKAFKDDQLTSAKMQFQVAQSIKPVEKLPAERIKEIDAILEQRNKDKLLQAQKELDERYRLALSAADNSFAGRSYSIAKIQYKQASIIKPEEEYPKSQMALCDKLLSEAPVPETYVNKTPEPKKTEPVRTPIVSDNIQVTEERARSYETITDFNQAIKKADDSFGIKDYSVARFFYLKASELKPKEEYPKNQIDLIRKLIDSQMSANDITGYDNAIAQADAAFAKQNYSIAKFYYYKAIEIKSWEKYPKDRINEILALTNSLLSEREEKEYQDAIAKGDEAFFGKDIAIARFYYNKAITIKKEENYPKIKLKEIQKLLQLDLAEQQDKEYKKIIEQGDQAMQYQNYSIARFYYNKALSVNPSDNYAKSQLKMIKESIEKSDKLQ